MVRAAELDCFHRRGSVTRAQAAFERRRGIEFLPIRMIYKTCHSALLQERDLVGFCLLAGKEENNIAPVFAVESNGK